MIKLIITFNGKTFEAYFKAKARQLYVHKDQLHNLGVEFSSQNQYVRDQDQKDFFVFTDRNRLELYVSLEYMTLEGFRAPEEITYPEGQDYTIKMGAHELASTREELKYFLEFKGPFRLAPKNSLRDSAVLKLKASTWDRLPTWGKVIVGGLLVIGTLVGLGAIAFGTMGLVAPAVLGVVLGALHLAGLSFPFAAFVGAIAGGAVAAFLFGVVPATTAITAKAVAKPAASVEPVISETDEVSCSDKLKGLFTCFGSDEEDDSLEAENQKGTCCTFGAKEASKAKAADTSCWPCAKSASVSRNTDAPVLIL